MVGFMLQQIKRTCIQTSVTKFSLVVQLGASLTIRNNASVDLGCPFYSYMDSNSNTYIVPLCGKHRCSSIGVPKHIGAELLVYGYQQPSIHYVRDLSKVHLRYGDTLLASESEHLKWILFQQDFSIAQWYSAGFECGRYPGSMPSQGPRHTKDVIKMVLPLFSTERSKGKILTLSQKLRQENKCNG